MFHFWQVLSKDNRLHCRRFIVTRKYPLSGGNPSQNGANSISKIYYSIVVDSCSAPQPPRFFFFSSPFQFSERTVAYTGRNSFYVFRHLCKRRGGIKSPHLAGIIPSSYIPLHPLSPRFLIATIRRKGEGAEV